MRIYIKTSEGKVLWFPLPISLVRFGLSFGDLGVGIAKKHVDEKTLKLLESIDYKLLGRVIADLKQYKGLRIIDVKSSNGEEVRITV